VEAVAVSSDAGVAGVEAGSEGIGSEAIGSEGIESAVPGSPQRAAMAARAAVSTCAQAALDEAPSPQQPPKVPSCAHQQGSRSDGACAPGSDFYGAPAVLQAGTASPPSPPPPPPRQHAQRVAPQELPPQPSARAPPPPWQPPSPQLSPARDQPPNLDPDPDPNPDPNPEVAEQAVDEGRVVPAPFSVAPDVSPFQESFTVGAFVEADLSDDLGVGFGEEAAAPTHSEYRMLSPLALDDGHASFVGGGIAQQQSSLPESPAPGVARRERPTVRRTGPQACQPPRNTLALGARRAHHTHRRGYTAYTPPPDRSGSGRRKVSAAFSRVPWRG